MYELKKIGKVFTSKSVRTGPSAYEKRIYRAAVSQRLRNTAVEDVIRLKMGTMLPETCSANGLSINHNFLHQVGLTNHFTLQFFTGCNWNVHHAYHAHVLRNFTSDTGRILLNLLTKKLQQNSAFSWPYVTTLAF